ncbi:MAG: ABC transporter permease [Dehalococcoidia bacterium]|nr:ABC transporter permease [Dehalococcoidia bacterium]MCA9824758.1 ABC transporter permease [Dehalococcoidia bacterium]MCA9843978.1 ABC transporter permease [Dehalococcoidia bacterium]MCA9853538.1 ABC transporter permease [Dehalococcoidia bacterium]
MRNYAIRRALINIPVIWFVATLVFLATSVLPGDFVANRLALQGINTSDPAQFARSVEAIKEDLGLNDPVHVRYMNYMGSLLRGDLGTSFESKRPAVDSFMDGLPYTLQLSVMTFFFAIITSIPIGIISAIRQDTWLDYILRIFAITALAAPNFWVATMILLYVVKFSLFSVPITESPLLWEDPATSFSKYIIPAVVGGIASGATTMRLLRSQMLEVLRQDYIRTAWAKGLGERLVILRHALKNAFIPVMTVLGLSIATLLSGNVVFEYIFGINGIGNRILRAIQARDVPVVQAFVLIIATFVVFVNLIVDLLYGLLDPRIRYS